MSVLTNISVYETAQKVYLVGEDREQEDCWRLLKIDRTNSPDDLTIVEDLTFYSRHQLQSVLRCLHNGNLSSGGLRKIAGPCPALIGACFSWTAAPYLLLVTRTRILGYINDDNAVYGIEATSLIPLGLPSDLPETIAAEEARARRLLSLVARTKDFFFSFSWPIWNTVQHNFSDSTLESPFSSDRVWNEHLTSKLRSALDGGGGGGQCKWVVPLVHGYFEQKKLYLLGRPLRLTLVARRSNRFAGTRYRKRGVTDNGEVANDVEIEQIVEVTEHVDSSLITTNGKMAPKMSSMVQVRGSVPLFWSQTWDTSTAAATAALRPTIRMLHHLDPLYTATRKHFDDLRRRYGNFTIHCLDLLRHGDSRQQESVLSAEYKNAIAFLNKRSQCIVGYVHWDLRRHAKKFGSSLLVDLQKVQTPLLANTAIFTTTATTTLENRRQQNHLQHGIVRTNCVDCLDRTNVAQFTFGLLAIAHQLHSLGLVSSTTPSTTVQPIDPGSSLAAELMAMYESMGHALAQQYGGSEAHTGFFKQETTLQHSSGGGMGGDWQANLHLQGRDLITSIKRFYSNAVTDEDKQAAINLFLGTFSPAVVAVENAKWTGWFQGRSAGASASELNSAVNLHSNGSAVNLHSDNLLLAPEPSLEDTATTTTTSLSGTPLLPSSLSTASLASELDGGGDISLSLPEILSSAVITSSNASSVGGGDGGEQRGRQLAEQQQQQQRKRWYSSPLLSSTSNAAGGLQSFDAMLNSCDVRHVSTTTARPARPPTVQPSSFVSDPPAPTTRLVRSNSTGNTPQLAVKQQQQQRSLTGNANNNNNNNNSRSARDLRGNLVILAPGETLYTHDNSNKNDKIDASVLPDGSSGYHTLAGLNLEGGLELLPSLNPDPRPSQIRPSAAGYNPMSRAKRVSFASLSALRQFVRGGGGASDGGRSTKSGMSGYASRSTSALNLDTLSTNFSTTMAPAAPARAGSLGAATSSDISYMFTQHHAVAHGLDDLGLPANIAPLYRRGSNIVSCFVEMGIQAAEEHARAMEKLAVPMDAAEHRASEREVAALLRPEVVVTLPEKA